MLRFLQCNFSFFIGKWYWILFTCNIRLGPSWLIVRSLPFSSPNLLSLLPYWPLSCTVFSFSLSNCSALFIKPSASLLILLLLPALIFIFPGLGLASFISVVLQLWHEQQVASKSSSIIFLPLQVPSRINCTKLYRQFLYQGIWTTHPNFSFPEKPLLCSGRLTASSLSYKMNHRRQEFWMLLEVPYRF